MSKFDRVDVQILRLIQQDARITIKEMASQLNLSTTPIFERLKRLERKGVIKNYVALLEPKKLGKKLMAFIHISVIDHSKAGLESFTSQVKSYPEVMECHHVTGDADFFLKIVVEDIERYNEFVTNKLSTVPNIDKVRSSFSLSVSKSTTAYEIKLEDLPKTY